MLLKGESNPKMCFFRVTCFIFQKLIVLDYFIHTALVLLLLHHYYGVVAGRDVVTLQHNIDSYKI